MPKNPKRESLTLLDAIEHWVDMKPFPVGSTVGSAEIPLGRPGEIPVVISEYVKDLVVGNGNRDRLDRVVGDIKVAYEGICNGRFPKSSPIYIFKSLEVLTNIAWMSRQPELLEAIAKVIDSRYFEALPKNWQLLLCESIFHATFELTYVEVNRGPPRREFVARYVEGIVENLIEREALSRKHAHALLFLACTVYPNNLGSTLKLLSSIEEPSNIGDFESMESWYTEPLKNALKQFPFAVMTLNSLGFNRLTDWYVNAQPQHFRQPAGRLIIVLTKINIGPNCIPIALVNRNRAVASGVVVCG
jgi:hypothetical protein